MDRKKEFIDRMKNFTKKKEFSLNGEDGHREKVVDEIIKIEKDTGLKFCPCQVRSKVKMKDLHLICPCHFENQSIYIKKGRCQCGLFTKD